MKMFSKTCVAACAIVACLLGQANAETLKLSHVRPQGTPIDLDLIKFAGDVEKGTNGKLKMKIYPANALGDYTVVQERVSIGAVDMSCQPTATSAEKRFMLMIFPYLVKDWAQAEANFKTGSNLRNSLSELFAGQGITLLATYPAYFGGAAFAKEPTNPTDPTANKKSKIRIPAWKSMDLMATNFGYQTAPLPYSEAFAALQTGVVDGAMGSGAEGYYSAFRDVTKFYIPLNTHFEAWHLIINTEKFESLDAEEQKALKDAALAFEQARWKVVAEAQTEYENKLAEGGTKIIRLTPEQLDAFAKISREKVWPEIMNDIGKEWAEGVLNKLQ